MKKLFPFLSGIYYLKRNYYLSTVRSQEI